MSDEARVEHDTVGPLGVRLTTVVWTIPRVVLAEARTHRTLEEGAALEWVERMFTPDLSKNTASSRAIPISRMIQAVQERPYVPDFGRNQKGMQATERLAEAEAARARAAWLSARDAAVQAAQALQGLDVHKQDANRLLEPWAYVTQVLTGDQYAWSNFFALRCDGAAHPAIRRAARRLYRLYRASVPEPRDYGQWHLPFVPAAEARPVRWCPGPGAIDPTQVPEAVRTSAARCAWVSYNAHDGDGSPEKVTGTFTRMTGSVPLHASPFEHQATPLHPAWEASYPGLRSNFTGWLQLRKLLPREVTRAYQPSEAEMASWEEEGE